MRALLLVCALAGGLTAADPRAISLHPFLGKAGAPLAVTVRGANLQETKAVFVEPAGAKVTVGKVDKASVELTVEGASAGRYALRLVTASGVSNALSIQITDSEVLTEPDGDHETPDAAVGVPAVPAVYTGRIAKKGESDFYAFDVKAGETLSFHVLSGLPSIGAPGGNANGFDPSISIWEPSGSWFDPKRVNRLAFNDEPLWVIGRGTDASLKHSFTKSGRFFARIEAFSGQGGPDYSYILRIFRGSVDLEKPSGDPEWSERTYQRPLASGRLNELAVRGGKKGDYPAIETYRPGGTIRLPAVLEGAIAQPGEAHRAKFLAEKPQDIAVEIETPDTAPPLFNPVVRLLNDRGEEVLTNFFAGRGACTGALTKGLVAKAIFPLRNPGEYTVEIRELTADLAEAGFRYRVMIRPQVPHLGQVTIAEDHINLAPGGAKTVRVTFDREEDYRGAVAVGVEGLPEGVTALAAADFEPDKDPPPYPGKRERYVARTERTVLAFAVAEDAKLMEMPRNVRVTVRPVVDGKPGAVIAHKTIPLMVVAKP